MLEAMMQRGDSRELVLEAYLIDRMSASVPGSQTMDMYNAVNASETDREFMLEATKQKGNSLRCAAPEHEKDREFMLKAMKQRGNSLKYVAPEHKFVPGSGKFVPGLFVFIFNFYSFQASVGWSTASTTNRFFVVENAQPSARPFDG